MANDRSRATERLELRAEQDGYFGGFISGVGAGVRYRYQLDDGPLCPDPYSRYQPDGPHGPSLTVDPSRYQWNDQAWRGPDPTRAVVYELHVGTFTEPGTFDAAADQLRSLAELGVTCIEIMPVAEFAGDRGWGYDGVNLFAPYHRYGDPDSLRRFVDAAHAAGLGVILDVVYNHMGADGNCLTQFSPDYFTDRYDTGWGQTFNYECERVREFAIDNAVYWIEEFHLDGLRLDATQGIFDPEHPKLLATIVQAARKAAGPRTILISGEDYLQRAELLLPPEQGGAGLDQLWNDDFHHATRVALTGNPGGYFASYRGHAQELLSCVKRGFLFQGQWDAWREKARGSATRQSRPEAFLAFTQNHDQVANTLYGRRLDRLTSPGRLRASTALLLLGPQTPMIFMGQEFDASSPFPYFADVRGAGADQLWSNRRRETADFEQYAGPAAQGCILDPLAPETAARAKLSFAERQAHSGTYRLFADLLGLRHRDAVLSRRPTAALDGAVLGERCLLLRWVDENDDDRLLLVNLGDEIHRAAIAEPLLAPPRGRQWVLALSSDDPKYGGLGIIEPFGTQATRIAAECATFLVARPA